MASTVSPVVECIWKGPNQLGEGPLWHPMEQVLYWIDITEPSLHRLTFDNDTNPLQHRSWKLPYSVIGCISIREKGGLIAAVDGELVFITCKDWETSDELQID